MFSDVFSDEKLRTMQAFGARIMLVPSDNKKITAGLIKVMISSADEISRRPDHWYCDQLNNHDAIEGYLPLGEELWQQTGGQIDALVQSVGTAHSIHGVMRALSKHKDHILSIAVELAESAVLSGRPSGLHQIEGIGIGFIPPLWQPARSPLINLQGKVVQTNGATSLLEAQTTMKQKYSEAFIEQAVVKLLSRGRSLAAR